jgi:hypothetical protein
VSGSRSDFPFELPSTERFKSGVQALHLRREAGRARKAQRAEASYGRQRPWQGAPGRLRWVRQWRMLGACASSRPRSNERSDLTPAQVRVLRRLVEEEFK